MAEDAERIAFLTEQLKSMGDQNETNRNLIHCLQREKTDKEIEVVDLRDRLERSVSRLEEEKALLVKQYQEEILKIQDQFSREQESLRNTLVHN
mmetsp:Transcript_22033/g.34195  ORF Transcript_22033/g.34195 Transcript_22033/m.34195 type:complete len:94 (-) Transcript_22033:57-338(-)|eukprot:CAMPEP_0170507950 /NCGR_PEP_ID=MMETSP0208-20121228/60664_1 /TAXON_ID=197538 /ORGANISM="Strombidium inclinatum, Strain S3" /LENGTH=93 /DNA_ID=CAMNT_0010790511 /DNA_START=349 /DNA_END=630 /DNA_ORIENTATION=+